MPLIEIDCRMYGHSGIGSYIRNLLDSSYLLERPGVRYRLLGDRKLLSGQPRLAGNPQLEIIDCRSPIYGLAEQIELFRATPRDIDLFWSPHYNIPLAVRKKLVVTIHDVNHLALAYMLDSAAKRWYAKLMYAAVRAKATRILCDSRFSADELARYTGIDGGKTTVVHLGVSPFWREAACPRPEDVPYFVFVGNIKPHKNLHRLITAFNSISAKIPHRLVIVGKTEGFVTPDREVMAAAEALGDRVKFTGWLDDDELLAYLNHADALVLPSLYEGFGLPPLEAMACGCPTLVSTAGSLPEVCGDASLFCDPLDVASIARQLLVIATDENVRSELRQKGREWVKRYDWETCAEATWSVVEEALTQ